MKTQTFLFLAALTMLASCSAKKNKVQFLATTINEAKKVESSIGAEIYILDSTKYKSNLHTLYQDYYEIYNIDLSNIYLFKEYVSNKFSENNESDQLVKTALEDLEKHNVSTLVQYVDFATKLRKARDEFQANEHTLKLVTDANGSATVELPAGKYYVLSVSSNPNKIPNPAELTPTNFEIMTVEENKPNQYGLSFVEFHFNVLILYTDVEIFNGKL